MLFWVAGNSTPWRMEVEQLKCDLQMNDTRWIKSYETFVYTDNS